MLTAVGGVLYTLATVLKLQGFARSAATQSQLFYQICQAPELTHALPLCSGWWRRRCWLRLGECSIHLPQS